jgi:hypothetical protein
MDYNSIAHKTLVLKRFDDILLFKGISKDTIAEIDFV